MSYIGNTPNFQQFAVQTEDGNAASYALDYTPGSATAILVFVDGVHQKPTTDYTVSGSTLTPVALWPAGTGNVIILFLGRAADVPTPADESVSAAKLATTAITGQTEDTSPDLGADYALVYDASAVALKKVLLGRFGAVSGTMQATTSGTSIDFTGIPSWVKRITMLLAGVSVSGTSALRFQIGDSGGIENTGYLGASNRAGSAGDVTGGNSTAGADTSVGVVGTTDIMHGRIVFECLDPATNSWIITGTLGQSNAARAGVLAFSKSLTGTLDRVRMTTANGTDTFDAGSVNLFYE